ncbi:MAG: hypothetical protein KKE71_05650, partial [Nanoarchaeota archaeon]|nr:hypothetical protein [Nanoarchaeota archaeon]
MKLNVKLEKVDDELMFKRTSICLGSKSIMTPIKASYCENPISDINEIYKKFSLEKLNNCLSDEQHERRTNSEIKREMTNGLNMCIVDYSSSTIPERKHIEMLADIQYEHSDIVVTPIFSNLLRKKDLVGESLTKTFIELTNQYIEIVETLNHKSIVGVIPSKMPRELLRPIVENYCDKNITSFVLDFDGRSIDNTTWIRHLTRLMNDFDLTEKSFLYSVNANEGKFMKNAVEIPAKDFINSGFGIDILGLNHLQPRMNS